jgi:aminobenzoyl-glutamate utilization protein B
VDAVLFTHVGNNLGVTWGEASGHRSRLGGVHVHGEAAHSAGAPWRGRSALDAVELMNIGWNFRREHLRPEQRSHYVITDGGDQPNVVPSKASSGTTSARSTTKASAATSTSASTLRRARRR